MRFSFRPATMLTLAAIGVLAAAAPGAAAASSGAGPAHRGAVSGRSAAVPGGTQVWVQRFGGPYISATASSVATNPSRTVVYVTGITTKKTTGLRDEVTVAYNAATGKQLWKASYQGSGRHPRSGGPGVPAITVSPDGATVYVAGDLARGAHNDYLVLAYNAATGAQLWAVDALTFASTVAPHGVAVSPDSKTVYVTGTQDFVGSSAYKSYVTFALNAATGATVWESKRATQPHVRHTLTSIAVEPDGLRVFIAGSSGIIALDAANGEQDWMVQYKQAYRRLQLSLAISADSQTLYVTGGSMAPGSVEHYWTAAIVAANGFRMWQATYHGPAASAASTAIALSPNGSAVYVTGSAAQANGLDEYTTIGYHAISGQQFWQASYSTPKLADSATAIAVSPDGSTVYVTGSSIASYNTPADYATVAYNAAKGVQLWAARYAVTGAQDNAAGVVASGGNAIVTGTSGPYGAPSDFATVAYQG